MYLKKSLHINQITVLRSFKTPSRQNTNPSTKLTIYNTLYSIYFIKKEFVYTKLKYSRVPQYDIVSGGVAALFSGFLGFLVAEKFGFELLDSGDFYFLFMYVVFAALTIRLLFKINSISSLNYWFYSPKFILIYIKDVSYLLLTTLKYIRK